MTFPSNSFNLNDILLSSVISHQRFFALITDCRAFFCAANFSENVLRGKSFRNDKKKLRKNLRNFHKFPTQTKEAVMNGCRRQCSDSGSWRRKLLSFSQLSGKEDKKGKLFAALTHISGRFCDGNLFQTFLFFCRSRPFTTELSIFKWVDFARWKFTLITESRKEFKTFALEIPPKGRSLSPRRSVSATQGEK